MYLFIYLFNTTQQELSLNSLIRKSAIADDVPEDALCFFLCAIDLLTQLCAAVGRSVIESVTGLGV